MGIMIGIGFVILLIYGYKTGFSDGQEYIKEQKIILVTGVLPHHVSKNHGILINLNV